MWLNITQKESGIRGRFTAGRICRRLCTSPGRIARELLKLYHGNGKHTIRKAEKEITQMNMFLVVLALMPGIVALRNIVVELRKIKSKTTKETYNVSRS